MVSLSLERTLVDGVAADSCPVWHKWLENITDVKIPMVSKMEYDLTKYVKEELEAFGATGYEFWELDDLYQAYKIQPVKDSQLYCERLYHDGYTLVPVSKCYGMHGPSKRQWIREHFPYMEEAILTGSKHFIRCDYIIEDRLENLVNFPEGSTTGFILHSCYLQ